MKKSSLPPLESENQIFKSLDFSQMLLDEHSFTDCTFEQCNFTESSWKNGKFCSCVFKDCNISLVKVDGCRFQDVTFQECKIIGIEFFKCDTSFLFSVTLAKSFLKYCNFSNLKMRKTSFAGSQLHHCTFITTNLTEANFSGTDLQETTFHNCDLSKVNFCEALNYIIDPRFNTIKKAKFSFPECIGLLKPLDISIVYDSEDKHN